MNRKLLDHLGGSTRKVDADMERVWQAADEEVVRGQGSEGRIKYQRPTNMRMSVWAHGVEGITAMRKGSGARG